jgi:hypothetical protein
MVSAGCALVSSQRGGWYRSGSIPPVDGIEETHELEGCWSLVRLFVQAGIP